MLQRCCWRWMEAVVGSVWVERMASATELYKIKRNTSGEINGLGCCWPIRSWSKFVPTPGGLLWTELMNGGWEESRFESGGPPYKCSTGASWRLRVGHDPLSVSSRPPLGGEVLPRGVEGGLLPAPRRRRPAAGVARNASLLQRLTSMPAGQAHRIPRQNIKAQRYNYILAPLSWIQKY